MASAFQRPMPRARDGAPPGTRAPNDRHGSRSARRFHRRQELRLHHHRCHRCRPRNHHLHRLLLFHLPRRHRHLQRRLRRASTRRGRNAVAPASKGTRAAPLGISAQAGAPPFRSVRPHDREVRARCAVTTSRTRSGPAPLPSGGWEWPMEGACAHWRGETIPGKYQDISRSTPSLSMHPQVYTV